MYGKNCNYMDILVYVISDMSAKLTADNVEVINQLTELNFSDVNNVTYQDLINARRDSMHMAYGYPMFKNSVQFWVLPSLPMGLYIDPLSDVIKEYTEGKYKKDILPFWDIEEIEEI